VARLVDQILTVDEEALARAQLICLERGKLLVEPAGAAGVAAIMDDPTAFEPPVVVVLSGGNVDPLLLLRVIRHGLAAAGRYASLRLKISDRPGSLARLLHELAEVDANIIEVEHARIDPRLSVDEVEVEVQIETRGKTHLDEVLARLAASGYQHVILE
jgi:threonine dehydratase